MAHTFEVAFSPGAAQQSGFKVSIGKAVSQVNQLGKKSGLWATAGEPLKNFRS
jgi:hypothetical protein